VTGIHRLFGSELSPYSIKVRAYFRYKRVPHVWIKRSPANEAEFRQYGKLPLVPTVAMPDGTGLQDSTPIMEAIDARFPTPSTHPADPALAFLSVLLEEYGDEWGNKLMFHHRWWAEVDQVATAHVLACGMAPTADDETVATTAKAVRERMTSRGHFVGSSASTAPLIRRYFERLLEILEPHLATRRYLFGARPAVGDFGLAAQLYECSIDPTAGGIIRARATNVLDWCHRMIEPRDDGPFESWATLAPTLEPLVENVGRFFLPWTTANARAIAVGASEFSVELDGETYTQPPQKYHAKSLDVLKRKYAAVADRSALDPILERTGCLRYLRGAGGSSGPS
jgi:glutathione S-transferase